jgi:hypothetical protein
MDGEALSEKSLIFFYLLYLFFAKGGWELGVRG